jgi:predicted AAA+ superfamily ATPase
VDFVLEWRGKLIPVEVKSTAQPSASDVRGLRVFMDLYRHQVIGGLVLHTGTECFEMAEGLVAAPIALVL